MLQGSISLPYYLSIINQGHGNILFRMKLGMCRFFTAIYNPFVCSLDVVIVVAVADHWDKSLKPWQLVEVLHGVNNIRVSTAGWRLAGVVSQAETTCEEPLDECQLRTLLLRVPLNGGWHAVKCVPCPDLGCCLAGSCCRGWLDGFIIPEHALACLYTASIVSTTGVAEFVPTPAQVTKWPLADKEQNMMYLWINNL